MTDQYCRTLLHRERALRRLDGFRQRRQRVLHRSYIQTLRLQPGDHFGPARTVSEKSVDGRCCEPLARAGQQRRVGETDWPPQQPSCSRAFDGPPVTPCRSSPRSFQHTKFQAGACRPGLKRHESTAAVRRDRTFRECDWECVPRYSGFMLATDGNLGVVEHSPRARNYRADKDLRHHKAKQPPMM